MSIGLMTYACLCLSFVWSFVHRVRLFPGINFVLNIT
jgi:hypothetical protein